MIPYPMPQLWSAGFPHEARIRHPLFLVPVVVACIAMGVNCQFVRFLQRRICYFPG